MRHHATAGSRRRISATGTVGRVVGVSAVVAGLALTGVQFAGAQTAAQTGAAKTAASSKATAPAADFDGDGHADVVSSAPGGAMGGKSKAGYVTVVSGSESGADTGSRQIISRDSAGVPGSATEGERWGAQTAARDLDGDGVTDLLVSGSDDAGGRLTVLWGAKGKGLGSGTALPDDLQLGANAFAAGDFNGDGKTDIVANKTGEYGKLRVAYGPFTRDGGAAKTADFATDETFDAESIVTGDVTGDGIDDVVTTHAFEEASRPSLFWKGTKDGLSTKPVETEDAATAVIGDVDGDGHGDLVIRSVPGHVLEDLPYDHGTLKVYYGTDSGPSTSRTTTLTQNSPGVPGANEEGDELGSSLAAGDVNGDGYADIAAGVPGEDVGSAAAGRDAGAVVQFYGSKSGLTATGAKNYDQSTAGVPGATEAEDGFGSAVTLQDTDGDGFDDLIVGAPGEDGTAQEPNAGAVWALRGASGGLTTDGVVSYGASTLGAPAADAALGTSFSH